MTKQGFGKLASLKEAFEIISSVVEMTGDEKAGLWEALGRVLAEDVKAGIEVPHFRKSAMDGFACIAEETFGASNTNPKELKIVESVTAGIVPKNDIKPGECIEITTGAPLPKSANAVLMVEYCEKGSGKIVYYKTCAPGENVIKQGSDIRKGDVLFKKGSIVTPRGLGAIAAVGLYEVLVMKVPTIAYFSTGNEVTAAGQALEPGKVHDINSWTIMGALKEHGFSVDFKGIVRDDLGQIKKTILESIGSDIVLLSGGSSLGGEDFMVEAVNQLGEVLVHGIAAKPGKPVLIGRVKGKLLLGLPGYPTSALSNTYSLVLPVLYKMMGAEMPIARVKAMLSRKIASTIGRYEFLAVKLVGEEAVPVMKGSSSITTLADRKSVV